MNGFRIWLIAVALLYGIFLGMRSDSQVMTDRMENVAYGEKYAPRMVRNIRVRNYNIVGENNIIYDHVPQRVIAIGENINETLVALEVEDKVVCSVRYGNPFYRPEPEYAERYNRIEFQDGFIIDTETALSLSPDLIISGQSLFTEKRLKDTEFWNRRKVNTFFSLNANSPYDREHRESLENEFEFILGLGSIFDREAKAKKLVQNMRALIYSIHTAVQAKPTQKVMIIEKVGRNLIAYDSSKLAGDICVRLGAYVPESPVAAIELEYLLEENPDVLFVVKSGGDAEEAADYIKNMPALSSLQCIREQRVYGIMFNYIYNSAIKTETGIRLLAKGIYPELDFDYVR